MPERFAGQVVLISGGARGQGRSHAEAFAREGADIAICDIAEPIDTVLYDLASKSDLVETAKSVEALGVQCLADVADVRDGAQMNDFVAKTIDKYGRIDVCLANAGIFTASPVVEMSDQIWQEMIDTNLTGVFNTVRAVLPTMISQRGGKIVATSSMAGKSGFPNIGHYTAAKWGIIGLIKSVALEVAELGITANVVCPTSVNTAMIQNEAAYRLLLPGVISQTPEEVEAAFAGQKIIPVPWLEPSDVTDTVLFLCSDGARYITGETISVAAGKSAFNVG
jgi:SDR family mycofactocin-dependent oxidoreductase